MKKMTVKEATDRRQLKTDKSTAEIRGIRDRKLM